MKLIPLTKGYFAKVDDEDFERLSKFLWRVVIARKGTANPYASRFNNATRRTILMHRELMNLPVYGPKVDHIDGDSLNNQKSNLRLANSVENGRNRKDAALVYDYHANLHYGQFALTNRKMGLL